MIFKSSCLAEEYKENLFFQEWHQAIIRDFNIFKIILEEYKESSDKKDLLNLISFVQKNIKTEFEDGNQIILKSTPNYFLFSFFVKNEDMPTYVLLSKDYKKFLIGFEEMECFEDEEFNEDERYGTYNYEYFILNDFDVKHYSKYQKQYTDDYTRKFYEYFYSDNIEETENHYKKLLMPIVKK